MNQGPGQPRSPITGLKNMLHRFLTTLTATFVGLAMHATHIIGGEIYYDHLGGDQYQVTLKLYRDCTGIAFDATALVGVFAGDGTYLYEQSLTFPGGAFIPITLDSPCLTLPPDVCIETTSYTGIFNLPPTPDGYHLTYQRCCRTGAIVNVPDPGDLGLTCTIRIPGQDVVVGNSSPRFTELPPVALCLDEPLVFDHSATDPDGDVLEYSLCTPYNGGDMLTPTPDPPAAPPYTPIPWLAPTYSEDYPMDSSPAIAIDATTGQLTVTPTLLGSYVVGVMVREYRNGVLLTESRRDFMFKVVACNATVSSGITPQLEFCTGLSMNFGNGSAGGQTWHWDFGVPGTDADTSNTLIPSWTYAEPGVYDVTLIANPGTICADTSNAQFQVFVAPEPVFTPPPPMCGSMLVTLIAGGAFGPGATLAWQLGGVTPPNGTGAQLIADLLTTGVTPVTLTATENGCVGSFSANIVVYPQPDAFFTVLPLR